MAARRSLSIMRLAAKAPRRCQPLNSNVRPHNTHMAALNESRVTLRFFSEELDPAEITAVLGVQPTDCYKKGQTRVLSTGNTLIYKRGMWRFEVPNRTPANLEAQIDEILGALTQDLAVWHRLASEHDVDLFCGLFMEESNEGFSLAPAFLALLSDRKIKIDFDVYAPSDKDHSAKQAACEA